jgi:hypothetical protein
LPKSLPICSIGMNFPPLIWPLCKILGDFWAQVLWIAYKPL